MKGMKLVFAMIFTFNARQLKYIHINKMITNPNSFLFLPLFTPNFSQTIDIPGVSWFMNNEYHKYNVQINSHVCCTNRKKLFVGFTFRYTYKTSAPDLDEEEGLVNRTKVDDNWSEETRYDLHSSESERYEYVVCLPQAD